MNTTKMRDDLFKLRNETRENIMTVINKQLEYLEKHHDRINARDLLLRSKAVDALVKASKEI